MGEGWAGGPMEHQEIVAWVRAHEQVLSANLEMISRYPMPFRKVIVNMMSRDNWVAVWREHLEASAASDATLDEKQKAFVLESAAALPTIFGSAAARSEWETRAAPLFTGEQKFSIFGTLGPAEPPGGLPLPLDAKPMAPA